MLAQLIILSLLPIFSCDLLIDPGHGGNDQGTSTLILKEKDLSLDYALDLQEIFKNTSYHMKLLRSEDHFISVEKRKKMIFQSVCKFMISLHFNSHIDPTIYGTEIYVGSVIPSPFKIFQSLEDFSTIIEEFKIRSTQKKSHKHALIIQSYLKQAFPHRPIKIKKMPLVILNQSQTPGLLIEIGYLSNKKDLELIQNDQFKNQFLLYLSKALDQIIKI